MIETSSHDEKHILQGCIALMGEMVDSFREYLDFIGYEPEWDEEKQPFVMSYFHIVQRLFLWNTRHSGGTSTMEKCYELGIKDSSENVEFYLWEDEVEYFCGGTIRFVVCGIDNGVAYGFRCWPDFEDLDIGDYCEIDELKKTGRHFPEVEKLLEEMRSDSHEHH